MNIRWSHLGWLQKYTDSKSRLDYVIVGKWLLHVFTGVPLYIPAELNVTGNINAVGNILVEYTLVHFHHLFEGFDIRYCDQGNIGET